MMDQFFKYYEKCYEEECLDLASATAFTGDTTKQFRIEALHIDKACKKKMLKMMEERLEEITKPGYIAGLVQENNEAFYKMRSDSVKLLLISVLSVIIISVIFVDVAFSFRDNISLSVLLVCSFAFPCIILSAIMCFKYASDLVRFGQSKLKSKNEDINKGVLREIDDLEFAISELKKSIKSKK